MRRSFLLILAFLLLLAGFGSSPVQAQGPNPQRGAYVSIPFHPVNQDYYKIKANIDAHAPLAAAPNFGPQPALAVSPSFPGLGTNGFSPSDANGAIGPDRYIETVNTTIGVYNRNGALTSLSTQAAWSGDADSHGDAVVMYSAPDQRFYATLLHVGAGDYQLIFGFSKTSTPSASHSDWCFYTSNFNGRYGTNLPDYPKLGDNPDFILIGVNTFQQATSYLGSDVAWVSKPPKGNISTCPDISTFKLGTENNLKNKDGSAAATPNPAKQADAYPEGVVIANKDPGLGTSTHLSAFLVTKDAGTGSAVFSAPSDIPVASYAYPPSAVQPGTKYKLDTLDARLMSAWEARDPSEGNQFVLWTGHTVKSSAGQSEFRWYEIGTGGMLRKGTLSRSGLYVFMGAISPDRNGAAGKFGSKAGVAFNISSSTRYPSAATVTIVNGVASAALVHASTVSDKDFTCLQGFGVCRWGDYSGASPDPASTTSGMVWGSAMLMSNSSASWSTWNWAVTP
jgi:hypothetical protein